MSFIEQHIIDPSDLVELVVLPERWDYTTYVNQYIETSNLPTLKDLSGLNSAGLADKMKVIKTFALQRAMQLTAICYTLVDVATAITSEASIMVDEAGVQMSQIPAEAAMSLLAMVRQLGKDLSMSISNQAGDFFNLVHTVSIDVIHQAQNTWNAIPYCVDYPNFKVLLGNGIHEDSGINDYKLENVVLAYDTETGTLWFNTTLKSLENHVSQAILDLDRQLLEQRGVFSLMAKIVDCLKNPSDVIGAIKAAAEEMFSELIGDIAQLYNGCISTYNSYGIGGVICYLIDYLHQGKDLVYDDHGRIKFADNAKLKTSSWLAGCIGTILTVVSYIVAAVVAMFNPVVGGLIAGVTTVLSTLVGAIRYNKDQLQNAKIEPEAELSGFPYGVVSAYSMSETLWAMCEDSPCTIDVPGGYFIMSKYDEQDKVVAVELHITPTYVGGSFNHLWTYLSDKGTRQFEDTGHVPVFKYRQFIVDGSDPHALDIEADLPNLIKADYSYFAVLNPESLDKALLFTFCFNLAIAYYYMVTFISNAVGKPLNPFDATSVYETGVVDSTNIYLRTPADTSRSINLEPCAALSCAFYILLNSTTVGFGVNPVSNFDTLYRSSGIKPSWINISDNSSILNNTIHVRAVGNTDIFGAGTTNVLPTSIEWNAKFTYYVNFGINERLYCTDYSMSDTLHPGISWKSGWIALMLETSMKKYNTYQLLTANGYVISTPKYDRNTYTASVILSAVTITAVAATVAIAGFRINSKLKNAGSVARVRAEQAWDNFKKDPSEQNRKAYRKAVRKNNILAKFGFGTPLDKYNYWGGESASGEADGNFDSYFEQINKKLDGKF